MATPTSRPPAAKRAPAKKTAAKKPAVTQLVGEFLAKYETTGTFRLDETAEQEDQIIGGLYLKKGPLDGTKPFRVRVIVEVLEVSDKIPVKISAK